MVNLEDNVLICDLIDCYKDLLTTHQANILISYYFDNMSYGEISQNYDCSRQSVQDIIKRSLLKLEHYEEVLGLNSLKHKLKQAITLSDQQMKNKLNEILEDL